MCVETKAEFGRLGSFSMRDMGRTVAAGFVIEVKPKNN
jgi:translation elongation factor EF-1alpha